jgi:hypothetical protein
MATLQNATHPKALANSVKHFAFTRCGELNLRGMVDAELAVFKGELLAGSSKLSREPFCDLKSERNSQYRNAVASGRLTISPTPA